MRRLSIPLLGVLATLLIPTAAHATGTGHSGPAPAPEKCACCGPLTQRIDQLNLVFDQRITVLEQKVAELQNTVVNLTNYVNEVNRNLTTIINRVQALTCQSDRVYEYRLRTQVDGSPIMAVLDVQVAPEEPRADGIPRGTWHQNSEGRFVITADYRGIEAPKLQFRTAMTTVQTANGKQYDLVQYVRICGPRDGDPNDRPAQDRAGDD